MNDGKFTIQDVGQAAIGAVTGVLGLMLFFVFGEPKTGVVLKPLVGLVFTVIFLILSYLSIKKFLGKPAWKHLTVDYTICLILASLISMVFNMVDVKTIFSFDFFGTVPIIVSWMIFIPAVVFDIKDMGSFMERYLIIPYNGDSGSSGKVVNVNPNSKLALDFYCTSKFKNQEDIAKCSKGEINGQPN